MIESNSFRNGKKDSYTKDKHEQKKEGITKEQLLLSELKNIALEYAEVEKLKHYFINAIINNLESLDFSEFIPYPKFYMKEKYLKKSVSISNIDGLNVVCVDGSSVIKKFMNVDFSFLKVIATKYHFYRNNDAKITFFPDLSGNNNFYIRGNYLNQEENAIEAKTTIDMNYMEINLLNTLIKEHSDIDLIIIDGSIVIMPINLLFSKDPEISKNYDILLQEYHKLYLNCQKKNIILIGSIKDTRTAALTNLLRDSIQLLKPNHKHLNDFININYRRVVEYFSDLDLFNRVLNKSERSCIFNCKREIEKIRDDGIKKEIPYYFPLDFYAFYLKTAKHDIPCRIEFFVDENTPFDEASSRADLISSILHPISSLNDHYGLPIPQIEAHRRAVFKPHELNLLYKNLIRNLNKNGFKLIEKRRDRRPF
ncbi:MAG: DNA double-strand break repair nuclease NurA [Promethearchaeota archaeon]